MTEFMDKFLEIYLNVFQKMKKLNLKIILEKY